MNQNCQSPKSSIKTSKKCFVGGLNPATTQKHLVRHFSRFGEINKVSLPRWNHSEELKGYAVLHFISESSVEKLLALKTPQVLLGSDLNVRSYICSKKASEKSKSLQQKKLYVSGFSANAKRSQILEFFNKFGQIDQLIMQHSFIAGKKVFKGFAFLIMSDKTSYDTLLKQQKLRFKNRWLSISKALSKEQIVKHKEQKVSEKRKQSPDTVKSQNSPECRLNLRSNIIEEAAWDQGERLRLNLRDKKGIENVVQLKVARQMSDRRYMHTVLLKQSYFGREFGIEYKK